MRRMLRSVRGRSPSRALEDLAWFLNKLPEMSGGMAEAWKEAERVVQFVVPDPNRTRAIRRLLGTPPDLMPPRMPSLEDAAWAFNRMTKRLPSRLTIRADRQARGRVVFRPDVTGPGEAHLAAWMLWRFFFPDEGWRRLKRCPQCRKWFVDTTKNRTKTFFPDSCKDRWWNRERRRGAGHRTNQRRPGKRKAT